MTSMRRCYVASTSFRRHVPAGNLAPLGPPNILNLPTPVFYQLHVSFGTEILSMVAFLCFGIIEWRMQTGISYDHGYSAFGVGANRILIAKSDFVNSMESAPSDSEVLKVCKSIWTA